MFSEDVLDVSMRASRERLSWQLKKKNSLFYTT
jgi:hypothetical protein